MYRTITTSCVLLALSATASAGDLLTEERKARATFDAPLFQVEQAACDDLASCAKLCRAASVHPYRGSENWEGAAACERTGDMYADGSASKKGKANPAAAQRSWHGGCLFGNASSCEKEAASYEATGTKGDIEHAWAIRAITCELGDAAACAAAAGTASRHPDAGLPSMEPTFTFELPPQSVAAVAEEVDTSTLGCGYRSVVAAVPFQWHSPDLAELTGMGTFGHCYTVWLPTEAPDDLARELTAHAVNARFLHYVSPDEVKIDSMMCMGGKPDLVAYASEQRASCDDVPANPPAPTYRLEWVRASNSTFWVSVKLKYTIERVALVGKLSVPVTTGAEAIAVWPARGAPVECAPGQCTVERVDKHMWSPSSTTAAWAVTIDGMTYYVPAF